MILVAPNSDPSLMQETDVGLWVRRLFAVGAAVTMVATEYVETEDCVTRLRKAKTAYQKLIMGESVQVVSHDGRTVTFIPGKEAALRVYIRELQAECDLVNNAGSRRSRGRARPMVWTR